MTTEEIGRVRVRIDLLLEVADIERLTRMALARISADELLPDEERGPAGEAVSRDPAEAIAYLVDPIELVDGLPGVELARASWSSETVDADDEGGWLDDEDDEDEGYGDDDEDYADGGGEERDTVDAETREPHRDGNGTETYDTGSPAPGGYGRLNGSA
ncbi:hypothetical protein [Streptomyces sp. ST2-7A]|uniref:hypothetical protein n=1 Tax=Streptomyces sp. ST2-7A TaxID=2907214 RepID=UPI002277CCD1|nr:hypothetical protein [Streptomyces sp. ST2-7A]